MKYLLNLPKRTFEAIKERQVSQRDLTKVISDYVAQHTTKTQNAGVIDPTPADNGSYKTQKDWRDFFNRAGKAMISASDVYGAPDSLLPSLREDFRKSLLVTGTRIGYNPNDLGARIVHNFGSTSTIVQPTERSLVVPVYGDEEVEKVAKGEGLTYLQWLFRTEDDASKLIGRLERISEKEAQDIVIWTPDQESRRNRSERAVVFDFDCGGFLVGGYDWFGDGSGGRSRGVSVKSAKPTARKKD